MDYSPEYKLTLERNKIMLNLEPKKVVSKHIVKVTIIASCAYGWSIQSGILTSEPKLHLLAFVLSAIANGFVVYKKHDGNQIEYTWEEPVR